MTPLHSLLESSMEETSTGLTKTLHSAFTPDPSAAAAVMTVSPTATAVTLPSLSTVATSVSPLVHVSLLSVASAGCTVATKLTLSPTTPIHSLRESSMAETSTGSTVTFAVAVSPPSVLAVIVVSPGVMAVTLPASTEAISASSDVQTTEATASSGSKTYEIFVSSPTFIVISEGSRDMDLALGVTTLTLHLASMPPPETVISASPFEMAATNPALSTVATSGADELQIKSTGNALAGTNVAVKVMDSSRSRVTLVADKAIPSSGAFLL